MIPTGPQRFQFFRLSAFRQRYKISRLLAGTQWRLPGSAACDTVEPKVSAAYGRSMERT
jgi:hypothetical protein